MRLSLYILGLCLVVATAFWSYRVTYGTQAGLDEADDLRRKIAREREAIAVLEAEWAWLNAPDRLERLVRAQNADLGLIAMTPERFADVADVPAPAVDDGLDPVDLVDLDAVAVGLVFAPAPSPRPVGLNR